MAKPISNRPIYLRLRDALVQKIAAGEWEPGTAIPTEIDLAREHGVSPGTMRKALDTMESERLITRKQGRGTFVNNPSSDDLSVRFSNIRDANGQRIAGVVESGEITQHVASSLEVDRLQLQSRDQVYRIRRVRSHHGCPYMIENTSLPVALFPGLAESKQPSDPIVVVSQRYGLLLGRAEERISIVEAEADIAEGLGLTAKAPILALDRVVITLDGRPAEWRVGYCNLVDQYYLAEMV
jgi:GntR family transcriptional regulator